MSIENNILPSSIRSKTHLAAFDAAMRDALAGLDIAAVLLHLTEQVEESALDLLIEQWGLTGEGVSVANATTQVKRTLLLNAALANQRRGTIWVVRLLFATAGIPDIDVVEATELNTARYYDGTWYYSGVIPYGFQWKWAEYAVRIYIDTATITIDQAILGTLDFILKAYTPARCKLIGYTSLGEFSEGLTIGEVAAINVF